LTGRLRGNMEGGDMISEEDDDKERPLMGAISSDKNIQL